MALGLGCLVGYARMASLGFVGYLAPADAPSVDSWYALSTAANVATLLLLSLNGWRKALSVSVPSLIFATAAAVAAPIVFAICGDGGIATGFWGEPGAEPPRGVATFGGFIVAMLAGISTAYLMYIWMLLLSGYRTREIVGVALGAIAVTAAIVLGTPRMDEALALVGAVATAFASGACALLADHRLESARPDGPLHAADARRIPWFMLFTILTCGFFSTVLYGITGHLTWLYDWAPNFSVFGGALAGAIAATAALMLARDDWMRFVWIPPLVLLTVALGLSCLSIRESIQAAVGIVLASALYAHFLQWTAITALFSDLRIPKAFLAAIVLTVSSGYVATLVGDALGSALPHSMQNLGGVAGIMVLALALLAIAAVALYRRFIGAGAADDRDAPRARDDAGVVGSLAAATPNAPERVAGLQAKTDPLAAGASDKAAPANETAVAGDGEEHASASNPTDALKARMDRYAAEYGLTPREREVALLTMQGFSCAYIAEKLVVSNSTVRFHQQNIYRKFDVHSRNELIELGASDEPASV